MGITFDTGALIRLVDQRHLSMRKIFANAQLAGVEIHVPAVVVTEWWRSGVMEKERVRYLRAMRVVPIDEPTARIAGEAMGQLRGATAIDAILMAVAWRNGDACVYTSDPIDLTILRDGFSPFRVINIERV